MLEHFKIFGLIINLIVGSLISLYIFQVDKGNKYPYIRALGFYTMLFNIAYLFLLFYSYVIINFTNDVVKQSLSKYTFVNEFFISVLATALLFFAYKIYIGFKGKPFGSVAFWFFFGISFFLLTSYILRFILTNRFYNSWMELVFIYVFENLILIEIIFLVLLFFKSRKSNYQNRIARIYSVLYSLRYVVFIIVYVIITSSTVNELLKAILGFSFLLLLNLLPLLWIRVYFIPFLKQVNAISDEHRFNEYCKQFNISQREKEILSLIISGKSNKEIGELLFISYSTVKNHVYNLYQKLNLNSRFELISNYNSFKRNRIS